MARTKVHADGIYFGLPMQDYLDDEAISASDIKALVKSPLAYWKGSPLNPENRKEEEEVVRTKPGDATGLGTYVHDIILRQNGKYHIKPEGMSFATKEGKAWRDLIPVDHEIVTQEQDDAARAIIEAMAHHDLLKDFMGGMAEVSVFWTTKSGNRCKIRADYLTPDLAIDIKTFDPSGRSRYQPITETIAKSIANEKYHVSAAWYQHGFQAAIGMAQKAGERCAFFGGEFKDEDNGAAFDLVNALANHEGYFPYWFYFMGTGGIPEIECKMFAPKNSIGQETLYFAAANREIAFATGRYAQFMRDVGKDRPWYDSVHKKTLDDDDLVAAQWAFK